jgi:hypothetical protein
MRTSTLAVVVALGTAIPLPSMAQQQTAPNRQMQEEADKGVKTRQSGDSGYVGEQEKQGSSAHAPGRSSDIQPSGGATSGMHSTSPSTTSEKSR